MVVSDVTTPELTYEQERDKPMPSKNHAIVQGNLVGLFFQYIEQYRALPEVKLILSPKPVVPDVCIYPQLNFDPIADETAMTEMPLCAIEIISASQSIHEMIEKAKGYFEAGVKSYWLVLPPVRNIYVFENVETYKIFQFPETLKDERLGIELDLGKVFR